MEFAEEQADTLFPNIDEILLKLKKCYHSLPEDKKKKLDSQDFLTTMGSLMSRAEADIGGAAAAAASLIGDTAKVASSSASLGSVAGAASTVPWWNVIHGLNIGISGCLLYMDIKKFCELNKMRQAWNTGGEARRELLKNPKFDKEVQMRDLINKIRDQILAEGY